MRTIYRLLCIVTATLSFAVNCNCQTQLSRWYVAPNAIDFLSVHPSSFNFAGTPPSVNTFNNICDNAGNLLFYITFSGKIYKPNGFLIGTLPAQYPNAEIAIIPNPSNAIDECSRKYYIVFPFQTTPGDPSTGGMAYGQVDVATSTYTTITNPLPGGGLGADTNPIAVSRVNSSGVRYLYFLAGSPTQNIPIYRVTSTGIMFLGTSAYNNTSPPFPIQFCREMELSNAGDKLAFSQKVGSAWQVVVVAIDPANGLPLTSAPLYTFNTQGSELNGLEFDNSGSKLYYAAADNTTGGGYGVYVKDLNVAASTPGASVAGTAGYGRCMLEKSFNGTEIICAMASTASTATVRGVDTSTDILDAAWSLSCDLPQRYVGPGPYLVTMPDQIDGENYGAQPPSLSPTIAGPLSFCLGTPLSFTGDDGPATAVNSQWEIQECDSNGTPLNPVNSFTSPIYNSPPGYYSFPTVSFIQCNKHYLITLKVTNSCGTDIKTATKVIFINCPPAINAGPDVTICDGDCATLTATGGSGKHLFNWSSFIDEPVYIGSGASIQVCPTKTTTYCVSTVDAGTGCKASDCVTVNVEKLDPSFSVTAAPVASLYQTFTAVPTQTSNTPPGFGFVWFVEELDVNGNTVYSVNSSNLSLIPCWWNFPGPEVFDGFDGLTHSLNASCSPAFGRFKYDTRYRITRGVWSNRCPWKQFSYLVSTSHP